MLRQFNHFVNRRILLICLCLLFLTISELTVAHSGHEHAPGEVQAPKGGLIQDFGEDGYLEVLEKKGRINIFLYTQDLKDADISRFDLKAQAVLPRGKGITHLKVQRDSKSFELSYDAKGAYRYTLQLELRDNVEKESHQFKYVIEPK